MGFDDGYSFVYSKRPGTPASRERDDVPLSEKKIRLSKVQSLIRENAEKYLSKLVGTTQQVLVEGASKTSKSKMFGRTLTNKIVNFEANSEMIGHCINIHITRANRYSLDGSL